MHRKLVKTSKMLKLKHLLIGDVLVNLTSTKLDKTTELPVSRLANSLIETPIVVRIRGTMRFKQGISEIWIFTLRQTHREQDRWIRSSTQTGGVTAIQKTKLSRLSSPNSGIRPLDKISRDLIRTVMRNSNSRALTMVESTVVREIFVGLSKWLLREFKTKTLIWQIARIYPWLMHYYKRRRQQKGWKEASTTQNAREMPWWTQISSSIMSLFTRSSTQSLLRKARLL